MKIQLLEPLKIFWFFSVSFMHTWWIVTRDSVSDVILTNSTDVTGHFARNLMLDTAGLRKPLLNAKSNLLATSRRSDRSIACCSNIERIVRPTMHTLSGSTVVIWDKRWWSTSDPVPPTPSFAWNQKIK